MQIMPCKKEDSCKIDYSFKSKDLCKSDCEAKVTVCAKVSQCKSDINLQILALNYSLNTNNLKVSLKLVTYL